MILLQTGIKIRYGYTNHSLCSPNMLKCDKTCFIISEQHSSQMLYRLSLQLSSLLMVLSRVSLHIWGSSPPHTSSAC